MLDATIGGSAASAATPWNSSPTTSMSANSRATRYELWFVPQVLLLAKSCVL